MKTSGLILAICVTLLLASQSQSLRRRPTPPSGYRYARRPIYTPRRSSNSRRISRIAPARRLVLPRSRIVPARSIHDLRPGAITAAGVVCPRANIADVRHVIDATLQRINSLYSRTYAIRSLQGWGREICKWCTGGRCNFDHYKVRVTASISPVCRSGNCFCGVEKYGRQMKCELTGWTKPGSAPYNIEIECGGRKMWPPRTIVVPAGRVQTKPRETSTTSKVSTTKALTTTQSKTTSPVTTNDDKVTTTTTTLIKEVPEQTERDEFDVSADGHSSFERPAPIVLWDETTSKATVVYPDPVATVQDSEGIEEEGFLQ